MCKPNKYIIVSYVYCFNVVLINLQMGGMIWYKWWLGEEDGKGRTMVKVVERCAEETLEKTNNRTLYRKLRKWTVPCEEERLS